MKCKLALPKPFNLLPAAEISVNMPKFSFGLEQGNMPNVTSEHFFVYTNIPSLTDMGELDFGAIIRLLRFAAMTLKDGILPNGVLNADLPLVGFR